jgi:hypothetical protein
MKTPEILIPALRQYRHNDGDGLLFGFDHDETAKIVNLMGKGLKAQSRLLTCYRTGAKPSEWVFDTLDKVRKVVLMP